MEVPSILLNKILSETIQQGASGVHFSVGSVPVLRLRGKMQTLDEENILSKEIVDKIIFSLLDEKQLALLEQKKEIIIAKTLNKDNRFKIDIYYQKNLPSISFNYIPNKIRNLNDLNLPANIKDLIRYKSGLLVIAGPNNSDKATTISVLLEEINIQEKKHILTLENPIEYSFINKKSIIEQRQVGQDVNSYVEGLEHCLKEDIDVIYIDEINEDFSSALPLILDLASGKALVIVDINATSSVRVIEKILDSAKAKISSEAARYILADVLIGVITQILVPARSGGQATAYEILIANSAIRSMIRDGKISQLETVIQTSRNEGMISMKKSFEELLNNGIVTHDEIKKFLIN